MRRSRYPTRAVMLFGGFIMSRPLPTISLSIALLWAAAGALAESPNPVQTHNSNAVWFENWTGLSNATMVIAAPNGVISRVTAKTGTPVFTLGSAEAMDGVYRYELRAMTDKEDKRPRAQSQQRQLPGAEDDAEPLKPMIPFYRTGHFVVQRGVIITPEDVSEEEGE